MGMMPSPHKQRSIPRGRLVTLVVFCVLVGGSSIVALIVNPAAWSTIVTTLIAVIGIVVALAQWLFPLPSHLSHDDAEPHGNRSIHPLNVAQPLPAAIQSSPGVSAAPV